MNGSAALCAVAGLALYVGHHVGDYWVQTDAQAREKGLPGIAGVVACATHCATYVATQWLALMIALWVTGVGVEQPDSWWWRPFVAVLVSGGTHYLADRREHGLMFWLARRLPGKAAFLTLGKPRGGHYDDAPQLATGAWALDQSWHLLFGVFVPALIIAS